MLAATDRALSFILRAWGILFLVVLVGPPAVVLALVALASAFGPFEIPAESYLEVLLTATGATIAFAALCFSYARTAADKASVTASLQAGRLFLAATVLMAVALGSIFFEIAPFSKRESIHGIILWLSRASARLGMQYGPALAALAVLRLYSHILGLARRAIIEFQLENERVRLEKLGKAKTSKPPVV